METNEPEVKEQIQPEEPAMVLNQEAQYYLQQIGKWASFLGIVGFVFCGLFFIIALFIGSIFTMMSKVSPMYAQNPAVSGMGPMLSIIYIVFDGVYFILVLFLYQFAVRIKRGIAFIDSALVTSAFGKLKSFFKAWGIITIVILSLYVLIFLVAIIVAIAASSMH